MKKTTGLLVGALRSCPGLPSPARPPALAPPSRASPCMMRCARFRRRKRALRSGEASAAESCVLQLRTASSSDPPRGVLQPSALPDVTVYSAAEAIVPPPAQGARAWPLNSGAPFGPTPRCAPCPPWSRKRPSQVSRATSHACVPALRLIVLLTLAATGFAQPWTCVPACSPGTCGPAPSSSPAYLMLRVL